ncbi:hypothetical protein C8R43DRAFT_957714 [Mycena crocata]|nr:hypothetical protein C8R43DRAFT_957714 [Mycena crocata]
MACALWSGRLTQDCSQKPPRNQAAPYLSSCTGPMDRALLVQLPGGLGLNRVIRARRLAACTQEAGCQLAPGAQRLTYENARAKFYLYKRTVIRTSAHAKEASRVVQCSYRQTLNLNGCTFASELLSSFMRQIPLQFISGGEHPNMARSGDDIKVNPDDAVHTNVHSRQNLDFCIAPKHIYLCPLFFAETVEAKNHRAENQREQVIVVAGDVYFVKSARLDKISGVNNVARDDRERKKVVVCVRDAYESAVVCTVEGPQLGGLLTEELMGTREQKGAEYRLSIGAVLVNDHLQLLGSVAMRQVHWCEI